MYIVGFNGPPRAGKDLFATLLRVHIENTCSIPTLVRSLSMPMRMRAFGALGWPYSPELYEEAKDLPLESLNGDSIRKFMIEDSEQFMKARYGNDVWCRLLASSIPKSFDGIVFVPDIGFPHEPQAMVNLVGAENFALVRLHRPGHDFSNDSRNYVDSPIVWDINNEGTAADLQTEAQRIYGRLVNNLGWTL